MSPLNRFMANSLKLGCFSNEKKTTGQKEEKRHVKSINKVGNRLGSMSMSQQNQIDTYRFGIVYPQYPFSRIHVCGFISLL